MKKISFIFVLICLDQLSKYLVLHIEETISITDFFRFKTVANTGIAFSLPVPQWIIVPLTIIISVYLAKLLQNPTTSKYETIGFCLILSGALGNLIDRVFKGHVIDFLSFWSFPIFNLADCFISIGIAILIVFEIKNLKKRHQ